MIEEPIEESLGSEIQEVQIEPSLSANKPELRDAWFWISWLMIFLVVILISAIVGYSQFFVEKSYSASSIEMMQFNMMSKVATGYHQPVAQKLAQLEGLKEGPYEQRLAYAVMLHDIKGTDEAIERLHEIDQAVEAEQERLLDELKEDAELEFPTNEQQELRRIIGELFDRYSQGEYDNSHLESQDRQLLESSLGWVGQIAVTPKKSPNKTRRRTLEQEGFRTMVVAMGLFFVGILTALAAFATLALFFGMMMLQQIYSRYRNSGKHAQVYIETFAIWIVLFFGLQIVMGLIGSLIGNAVFGMALTLVAFFGSLLVLVWPVYRGIAFKNVCKDIGWELNNPIEEIVVGCFSYLALLVPMFAGLVVTMILGAGLSLMDASSDFQSTGPAGHPIAEEIATGGPIAWLFIFLSACVAAPIVEETMFRGVLYRSLRETSGRRLAQWMSIGFSSVFGGLIFASVHPQGIVGIPVLTTLAIGFSLVREWRSSLIGPMVMHAINNSVITCIMLLLFT